ncbi:MAG: hypothetical protein V8S34_02075 [Lawsonibacter sp.]
MIFGEKKIAIDCACGYDGGRLGCLNSDTSNTVVPVLGRQLRIADPVRTAQPAAA